MSTFYSATNILRKNLRTHLLFLCTLYSFSEGNTQTYITAPGGMQSGIPTRAANERGVVKNGSEIDTKSDRSEVRDFYIKKVGSGKVLINWSGHSEADLNYFTVERSRDGINYDGKAIVFGSLTLDSNQQYSFTDKGLTKGSYFYRLKRVNNDGSYRLCATNTVYINDEKGEIKLVTFPNPSGDEIKVILPDSWLQKKVTFEFYNTSGQIACKQTASSAGKTEALNIAMMPAGLYTVKAFTPNEYAAIIRIIKR